MGMSVWLKSVVDEWDGVPSCEPPGVQGLEAAASWLAQGQTATAQRAAEAAFAAAHEARDGAAAILALRLSWLAESRRFNYLPGGRGLTSADAALCWNGLNRLKQIVATVADLRTWPGADAVRREVHWLEVAAGLPVSAATVRDAVGTPLHAMMVQMQTRSLESQRASAAELSLSAEAYVVRSLAALCRLGDDREGAVRRLAESRRLYETADDATGVAACDAVACEWMVAPWSAASVRNLEIIEAAFPTSQQAWEVEQFEGGTQGVDIPAAQAAIERARTLARQAQARRVLGSLALSEGYLHRQRGDVAGQLDSAERAIADFAAARDTMHLQLARTHRMLAQVDVGLPEDRETAADIGRWGAGEGSFSYALGLGLLLTRAARQTLLREGDYERAEASLQLSLALNRALGAEIRVAQTLADLGELSGTIGERSRARTLQAESMDMLARLAPKTSTAADRLATLAEQSYLEAEEHQDADGMQLALDHTVSKAAGSGGLLGMAVGLAVASTRRLSAVTLPLYRGVAAQRRGEERSAETAFDSALAAARADTGAEARMLEAVVLGTRRRYVEAQEAYDRYMKARSSDGGVLDDLLGTLKSLEGGDRADHEASKAKAREAEQDFSMMVSLHAYARAEQYLERLKSLAGKDWYRENLRPWRGLSEMGEMCEGMGRFVEALGHYEAGIDRLEERRALLSRDDLKTALSAGSGAQHLYFQASRAALRLAQSASTPASRRKALEHAFALAERGRARDLLDLMATNLRLPAEQESAQLRAWREWQGRAEVTRGLLARALAGNDAGRIDPLKRRVAECDEAAHQAARSLAESRPELAQVVGDEAPILTVGQIAALLPQGAAMLQYMTLGDELLLWAVTPQGVESSAIIGLRATELADQARGFYEACRNGAPMEPLLTRAEALSKILLLPFEAVLERYPRLIIVPYGELFRLPFGALRWRGRWLAECRTLTQLPSASVLQPLTDAGPFHLAGGPALAVGGPTHMSWTTLEDEVRPLRDLPGARDEARYVACRLEGQALVGEEATKPAVLDALNQHRVFHFATHGILYEEAPLLSGIALANGQVLSVHDLLARRFQAELVTLSACDTGAGVLTGGQELIGLSRGLLAAGAKRVVVSLWPVADGATAVQMSRFADALKHQDDPAAALQVAQAAVRALDAAGLAAARESLRDAAREVEPDTTRVEALAGEHPQRWAAFVVIGV